MEHCLWVDVLWVGTIEWTTWMTGTCSLLNRFLWPVHTSPWCNLTLLQLRRKTDTVAVAVKFPCLAAFSQVVVLSIVLFSIVLWISFDYGFRWLLLCCSCIISLRLTILTEVLVSWTMDPWTWGWTVLLCSVLRRSDREVGDWKNFATTKLCRGVAQYSECWTVLLHLLLATNSRVWLFIDHARQVEFTCWESLSVKKAATGDSAVACLNHPFGLAFVSMLLLNTICIPFEGTTMPWKVTEWAGFSWPCQQSGCWQHSLAFYR